MRFSRTLGVLGTATAIYVLMGACGGSNGGGSGGSSSASGSSSNGASTSSSGHGGNASSSGGGAGGKASSSSGGGASSSGGGSSGGGAGGGQGASHPTSGSRLKARIVQGDDGSIQYVAGMDPQSNGLWALPLGVNALYSAQPETQLWHDSQRNEDCVFQVAADGAPRCLPYGTTFQFFKDPACTQGLVPGAYNQQAMGCPQPPAPLYAIYIDYPMSNSGCPANPTDYPVHVFQVGNQIKGQIPQQVYQWQGVSCVQSAGWPGGPYIWDVGAEIDPKSFVEGSFVVGP